MDTMTSEVRSAARLGETQKVEPMVLGVGGGLLLLLATFFLWQELAVQTEVLMLLGSVGAAGIAFGLGKARVPVVGPVLLLSATGAAGLWYGATREPMLLVALLIVFAATVVAAVADRLHPVLDTMAARWHRLLGWHGVALSGLAASFAAYFHVFDASDLGVQHFVARRALLTLTWLLAGVALILTGRGKRAPEIRDAGFLVLAASMGKLLVYDTTHLDGFLRIGALAIAGLVLLVSAQVARTLATERS